MVCGIASMIWYQTNTLIAIASKNEVRVEQNATVSTENKGDIKKNNSQLIKNRLRNNQQDTILDNLEDKINQ